MIDDDPMQGVQEEEQELHHDDFRDLLGYEPMVVKARPAIITPPPSTSGTVERLLADPGAKPGPRVRLCARCVSVDEASQKRGDGPRKVNEVESYTKVVARGGDGKPSVCARLYFGTCRYCTDLEWTERYRAEMRAAERSPEAQAALRDSLDAWRRRGRKAYL